MSQLSVNPQCVYTELKRGSVGPLTALQPHTPRDLEEERHSERDRESVEIKWQDKSAMVQLRLCLGYVHMNGWMIKGRREAR